MKYRLIYCFLIFMVTIPGLAYAQSQTASYVPQDYVIKKKQEKVSDIAQKLKIDPALLSAMNDSLSLDSVLTKGQKIRVPVYYDGKMDKQPRKGKNSNAETNVPQKVAGQPALKPSTPSIDTELVQNKILLTDATLELNRALLQGIQASLDTLNVDDKTVVDDKNIRASIHSMQRRRDKVLLTPFLLHMQDSLTSEITKEESEKASLENMLGLNKPKAVQPIVVASNTKKYGSAQAGNNMAIDTAGKIIEVTPATIQPSDKAVKKTGKPNKTKAAKNDNTNSTVLTNPSSSATTVQPGVRHWETAKAIYYSQDTAQQEPGPEDSVFAELAQMNNADSDAYVPSVSSKNPDAQTTMSDSVRQIKAQLYLTKAMKASNDRNYRIAVENLKKAIDLLPRYYDAWFALGEADAHLGLLTKALNEYRTCATIDSGKAVLYYKMGNIQLKLKQKSEAAASFTKSLSLDSVYIPAIMGNATIDIEKKRYKAAVKEYTRVLEIDWGYHTAYRSRAMAQYYLKNYDAAIDDFTRYIIFDETDASVYYYRGQAKLNMDEAGDACADFSISAKLGSSAANSAIENNCK